MPLKQKSKEQGNTKLEQEEEDPEERLKKVPAFRELFTTEKRTKPINTAEVYHNILYSMKYNCNRKSGIFFLRF